MHSLEGVIEGVHVRDVDALLALLFALSALARPFVRLRKGADFVACDSTKLCERKKLYRMRVVERVWTTVRPVEGEALAAYAALLKIRDMQPEIHNRSKFYLRPTWQRRPRASAPCTCLRRNCRRVNNSERRIHETTTAYSAAVTGARAVAVASRKNDYHHRMHNKSVAKTTLGAPSCDSSYELS
jgi:hypothetical protein